MRDQRMFYFNYRTFLASLLLMLCVASSFAQDGLIITGNVSDEQGNPLPGASIVEKGTTNGTQTDFDGNFTLAVADGNSSLLVSYIGFLAKEIVVAGQTNFSITLVETAAGLDEVVVIGYGTKQRRDLTGAISSIDTEELQQRPVVNIAQAVRGRVPGLIAPIGNSPDGAASLQVRGQNSFGTAGASNAPLIVLDGQIFYGSLSDINPVDVQSIDVLKDASSAAIFGARSSAGVIMVTTKKGLKGKTTISINSSVGMVKLASHPNFRNPDQYLEYRVDAFEGLSPNENAEFYRNPTRLQNVDLTTWRNYSPDPAGFTDNELWFQRLNLNSVELENYEEGNTINWFDETTQIGYRTENSISVSGSSEKSSHYFSIGHTNNEGFIVGENFEAIRTRFNLESQVQSFLKMGANIQFSQDNNAPLDNGPDYLTAAFNSARLVSPYGNKYNEDGTIKREPHNDALALNPFLFKNRIKNSKDSNLVGNIFAELTLPWGFKYRVNWINSMRWYHNLDFAFTTPDAQGAGGERRNSTSYTWNVDNILTWNRTIAEDHAVDLTFLLNAESQENYRQTVSSSNFVPSEILGYHQLNFGANPVIINDDSQYTADAQMARLNYVYKGKYLLTGSIRRDGYSAFGANNRRATFKAGALAWNASEENFLESADWLDLLKLRVSWGENGNRSIPLYQSLAGLGTVEYIFSDDGSLTGVTGLSGQRLSNPNLRWESTESLNVGFDFSAFAGKLSGSVEYYNSTTTDLLVERALPDVTGFDSILSNLGELGNQGIELSINAQIMDNTNFSWNSNLVYFTNKNEIKALYGDVEDVLDDQGNVIGTKLADDLANRRFLGQSIDAIYDFELGPVYQTNEEAQAAEFGLVPGDFRVIDQDGDGSISSVDDQIFLGQTSPKHNITFINDFSLFQNFQLSVGINGQFGHKDVWNGRFGGGLGSSESWQPQRMNGYNYPYWTPDNPLSDWARIGSSNIYAASSYDSKSFVRIQNITFGYDFPAKVVGLIGAQALKLSADLSNVAIFTNWEYFDPELYNVYSNPDNFGSRFHTPPASMVPFLATARLSIIL
ncbi:SusC/RagA family TonB-linked outer membrane protein [Flagellimonas algicola]|uniref:SusC/RagA family TonB-linked outer membrane protein n=1 Tax=Flagellimonas algicola TaxID=2583815 RepID=A0ABY2WS15_9FLAO|nr:SusC/RagA family TonB-linked outer membrane protein [Allomuricauda algicola]TMU57502.1 SusC/RagA family TonB-linked outer membrane protein [Allomuricauda algicola]